MRKAVRKRAQHGVTSLSVLDALQRLHTQYGGRVKVSRADLLKAVRLPESTVDDRLRTLVKDGRVLRVGRALYEPMPWQGTLAHQGPLPPGSTRTTIFPDGTVVTETRSA
ncbi:MAG: hypothetical protein EON54_21530 [Alcaligenaceae bacterium]|nr:MAG: hypothetical protein EON54_21530 [Alcaligenaceae bacterium]